jgi:hypothetical protein
MVWAVLQFAIPAAAASADVLLERESAGERRAHVESSSGVTCRAVHPATCALCQFLSRTAAPSQSSACPAILGAVRSPLPRAVPSRGREALARLSLARAPPPA